MMQTIEYSILVMIIPLVFLFVVYRSVDTDVFRIFFRRHVWELLFFEVIGIAALCWSCFVVDVHNITF